MCSQTRARELSGTPRQSQGGGLSEEGETDTRDRQPDTAETLSQHLGLPTALDAPHHTLTHPHS